MIHTPDPHNASQVHDIDSTPAGGRDAYAQRVRADHQHTLGGRCSCHRPMCPIRYLLDHIDELKATPAATNRTETQTRAALDDAIHAHAADKLDDDELIVNWIVVVGTRKGAGGGYVITMAHEAMPQWEAEGILGRALKTIDAAADDESED